MLNKTYVFSKGESESQIKIEVPIYNENNIFFKELSFHNFVAFELIEFIQVECWMPK